MLTRKNLLLGGICGAGLAVVGLTAALLGPRIEGYLSRESRTSGATPPPPPWPAPQVTLRAPSAFYAPDFGERRIFIDAGHGAPGNPGNVSCFCVDEQDFTLEAARALGERLEATGRFEVRLSRDGAQRVAYRDRVDEAARWGADALLSLHSDVRGKSDPWSPTPGASCLMNLSSPGFSVLWSDEGDPALASARQRLARAAARRMQEAGFLPYLGGEYTGLYEADAAQPGVFVDRHAPDQRIFVLRKPSMPSILIETHHALDPREATRWKDPRTLDAFAAATAAALADALADAATENRQRGDRAP